MSVPFHIEEEIMKRLPVKSLIQFRSVSKAWKSLIDSSQFIAAHILRSHTRQQHLLVSYEDLMEEKNYVSYIDDDTFPQQRSVPALPPSFKRLKMKKVIGSSRGLLCFYGLDPNYETETVVLWNPSIRKSIAVGVPDKPHCVGFGVCPVTGDCKIVSITECWDVHEPNPEGIYRRKVMVYTLSSGKWRTLSTNLPTFPWFYYLHSVVVTADGFIYWHEEDRKMIMSFDVTNESFEVIDLPNSLATFYINIYKIRESLAIVQFSEDNCDVWMMEHGVHRLFTKLFTIKTPHLIVIVGFRKNGVPIINVTDGDDGHSKLVVYEPNSEHNNVLVTFGLPYAFHVTSYYETLLFLGRSDCISC